MNLIELARLRNRRTARFSSWDVTGRNADSWQIPAGQTRVLADIKGPGFITHIWMTQGHHYRECLLRITWDDAPHPSVICPLGDFFGLGHGLVNSYQSVLFTASTARNNEFNQGCALNCYAPMPFRRRALVELVNESGEQHNQYFYVDYETVEDPRELEGLGYFHAEFRRTNPFGGWGHEIQVNTPEANIVNKERLAWDNNYVILETRGRGQYLGCNLSVANFQGTWWGEGDDMIWVDGYKWPPDLHGTGSEDCLNQAWGMQPNAFLRNGSSIFEGNTLRLAKGKSLWMGDGGYQTSYVHHLENPVRFSREIKVTIEHGHGNHLANDMSSVAYWYAAEPARPVGPPPVAARRPSRKVNGKWVVDDANRWPGKPVTVTDEMREMKVRWQDQVRIRREGRLSPWHSPFVRRWKISRLFPPQALAGAKPVRLSEKTGWKPLGPGPGEPFFVGVHDRLGDQDGIVYLANRFKIAKAGEWILHLGHDGGAKLFVDGRALLCEPTRINPCPKTRSQATVKLAKGIHEITVALDTDSGMGWGIYFCFEATSAQRKAGTKPVFPTVA